MEQPPKVSPSILLVDDEPELLKALTKVLEKEGYRVVACHDADSALAHLASGNGRTDLVISDVCMPGVSGLEFLGKLRAAHPAIPFVLITAFNQWEPTTLPLRDGAVACLDKPLDKTKLLDVIRRAVGPA